MARNYDWSPTGYYSDPVPGVPSDLRTQVTKYKNIATNISTGANNLQAIINNYASQSEFIEAFSEQAEEVIGRIRKAKKKYTGFAEAIEGYIEPLATARRDSYNLLLAAQTAQSDLAYAEKWAAIYYQDLLEETDEAEQTRITKKLNKQEQDAADARDVLTNANNQMWQIVDTCHKAAKAAADAIQETGDASGINDSAWVQFWEEHGATIDTIVDIIGWVGAALVIVALFVPGLNVLVLGSMSLIFLIGAAIALIQVANAVCQLTAGTKSVQDAIVEIALAVIPVGIAAAFKPAASALKAGQTAATQTLWGSISGQGVEGFTQAAAGEIIENMIKGQTAGVMERLLVGGADDLAKLALLQESSLTLAGTAGKAGEVIAGQLWKFALESSPLIQPFIDNFVIEPVVGAVSDSVFGDDYVSQPDTW